MKRGSGAKARVLQRLQSAWESLQNSYADLSEAELLEPGVTASWSVRDVIAHVTWWEEEALTHLPVILTGGRPPRYSEKYGGINGFNARKTEEMRGFSLAQVLQRRDEVHRRLVALVHSVPDHQLIGETRFRRRLRLDAYGHYPKHERAICSWRDRRASRHA
jgi:DinB superfamily